MSCEPDGIKCPTLHRNAVTCTGIQVQHRDTPREPRHQGGTLSRSALHCCNRLCSNDRTVHHRKLGTHANRASRTMEGHTTYHCTTELVERLVKTFAGGPSSDGERRPCGQAGFHSHLLERMQEINGSTSYDTLNGTEEGGFSR